MTAAFRLASAGLFDEAASEAAAAPPAPALVTRVDGVMGGRPVIRGTRITVKAVKGRVSRGDSLDDLVSDYPDVAREAFEAALSYEEPDIDERQAV